MPITKKMSISTVVKDFEGSHNKKFRHDSRHQRWRRAVAAYMRMHNEEIMGMGTSSPTAGTGGFDMPECPLKRGMMRRRKPVDVLGDVLAKRRRRNVPV